jgi:undecaprenyl-diphosphatase
MDPRDPADRPQARPGWLGEASRLDAAVYAAIAATPTPRLDAAMRRLSRAADHSKLSIAVALGLAAAGGAPGRRAAANGLACTVATSFVVNALAKPAGRRTRPDTAAVPTERRVGMPRSRSFPSGHAASAFAFAGGVGASLPAVGAALHPLATLVAYSRVHTGVHYPSDVLAGAVAGIVIADLVGDTVRRRSAGEARRASR